ncbi:PEP-CTERM sorting domain-containing protein [Pseudoduganella sp. UC29_106]|uniref:PEP-CTERM sorting domain-containing protein n=1 Tax=Pseudoduganella sp. UC29_106 TaxID=3374553 RepID=UPI00375748F3
MYLQQKFKCSNLTQRAGNIAAAAALLACAALPAQAETLTINASTHGSVSSSGGSNGAESFSNMFTGKQSGKDFNSWASFYIPPGHYTFASMTINPGTWGDLGPNKIGIFDVSTNLLDFDTFSPGVSVFNDLGSGAQYGAVSITDVKKSTNLSGNAVYDINAAAGGYIVFGFTNFTTSAMPDLEDGGAYLGYFTRTPVPLQLNLELAPVPEPGTWAMFSGGLGLLGCIARRRRKQAS